MVTDRPMEKFRLFYADGETELYVGEKLLTIHRMSKVVGYECAFVCKDQLTNSLIEALFVEEPTNCP